MNSFEGEVVAVKELRQVASSTDSTLQVDIKLPSGVSYKTAENLKVYPENNRNLVQKALSSVGLTSDTKLRFEAKGKLPFPNYLTAGELFLKYIDLQGCLSKAKVKQLRDLLPTNHAEIRKE
jgi:sulfite reductase alpha subunit-like flavoprotein